MEREMSKDSRRVFRSRLFGGGGGSGAVVVFGSIGFALPAIVVAVFVVLVVFTAVLVVVVGNLSNL